MSRNGRPQANNSTGITSSSLPVSQNSVSIPNSASKLEEEVKLLKENSVSKYEYNALKQELLELKQRYHYMSNEFFQFRNQVQALFLSSNRESDLVSLRGEIFNIKQVTELNARQINNITQVVQTMPGNMALQSMCIGSLEKRMNQSFSSLAKILEIIDGKISVASSSQISREELMPQKNYKRNYQSEADFEGNLQNQQLCLSSREERPLKNDFKRMKGILGATNPLSQSAVCEPLNMSTTSYKDQIQDSFSIRKQNGYTIKQEKVGGKGEPLLVQVKNQFGRIILCNNTTFKLDPSVDLQKLFKIEKDSTEVLDKKLQDNFKFKLISYNLFDSKNLDDESKDQFQRSLKEQCKKNNLVLEYWNRKTGEVCLMTQ